MGFFRKTAFQRTDAIDRAALNDAIQKELEALHEETVNKPTIDTDPHTTPRAIGRFGRVLSLLAQDAKYATTHNLTIQNKLISLTRWVVALTIALFILTTALLAVALVQTYLMKHPSQHPNQEVHQADTSEHH